MKSNKKGFTLAELLIVVAIIAVLVAIAILVFSRQLEKSRESTDLANVRSAYADVMAAAINEDTALKVDGVYKAVVPLKQKVDGWQTNKADLDIGGITANNTTQWINEPKQNGSATVSYDPGLDLMKIDWGGAAVSSGEVPGGNNSTNTYTGQNSTMGKDIGDAIRGLLKTDDLTNGSINFNINVNPDGTYSISFNNAGNNNLSESDVKTYLEKTGMLEDGRIPFNKNDNTCQNGYIIKIHMNGNGGSTTIDPKN